MNSKLNLILNRIHGVECSVMSILKNARNVQLYEPLNFSDEMKLSSVTHHCIEILKEINNI